MIKRFIQYLRKRKDMKLRKWCIALAASELPHREAIDAANEIYKWVKERESSKDKMNNNKNTLSPSSATPSFIEGGYTGSD